jgi:ribokinase
MKNQNPIVVVGSINLDLVAIAEKIPAVGETILGTGFQMNPGGKGANQAVAVAQLGYPVQMIGSLGTDLFGTELRRHLEDKEVGTSGIHVCEGSSGVALILVSSKGENSIVVAPGANSAVTPELVEGNLSLLRDARAVLAQLEIPIETVAYLAKFCARENIPLILDPAPAAALPDELLRAVHWFTPNETEAAFFAPQYAEQLLAGNAAEAAKHLLARGCQAVAIKMGSRGVYLASESGLAEFVPAFKVDAVDSTGAGDAFNGAFAVGLALGMKPVSSAVFASAVAGISVTRRGAQAAMPTMTELEDFLKKHADDLRVKQLLEEIATTVK